MKFASNRCEFSAFKKEVASPSLLYEKVQAFYLLGLSSRLLWGLLVFLALSIFGTAGVFGTDGRVAAVSTDGSDTPGFERGTEGDESAFSIVTSFAPLASSPQWGQNLRSFKMEAQTRWKRWEMLPYGLHSIKVPCGTEYLSCHFEWHLPCSTLICPLLLALYNHK